MTEGEARVEIITPEMAAAYLSRNVRNRHLRSGVVKAYARDIQAGDWVLNGEAIKFDAEGNLVDGQHRLEAIILADRSMRTLVIRGVAASAQMTMDTGLRRKFADQLRLAGEVNYNALASVARAVCKWERGVYRSGVTVTNTELQHTLDKYPDLREATAEALSLWRRASLPPSVGGLCWWLFTQLDRRDAEDFFYVLGTGEGLLDDSPVYALRRLIKTANERRTAQSDYVFLTAVTIKAWNAFRVGRTLQVLTFKTGGLHPERFPEPR